MVSFTSGQNQSPIKDIYPVGCNKIYKPVCGGPVSGCGLLETFSNECMLRLYTCQNPKTRKFIDPLNVWQELNFEKYFYF